MTISKTEFNTMTETAEIWNYHMTENGRGIISSELVLSIPVAPWADKYAVMDEAICLALNSKRWAFGR